MSFCCGFCSAVNVGLVIEYLIVGPERVLALVSHGQYVTLFRWAGEKVERESCKITPQTAKYEGE